MIKLFVFLCFSIVAGRQASSDGTVLFGHNEDDSGVKEFFMNRSPQGLWAEVPGYLAADGFVNRWGVAIASDSCPSREDREDFTDGGVLYEVRYNVYCKARSARDAALLIGEIVESRGYTGSGRSYIVADSREAWVVSVVRGRHWVARRVPDDAVMTIPNYYTIGEVDLSDKKNFLGSQDLIEYAVSRGWYDPGRDGNFSFRDAYAAPATMTSDHNTGRHSTALEGLGLSYDPSQVSFCIKPSSKITLQKMEELLSARPVSAPSTIYSFVYQAGRKISQLWFCPEKPCGGTFSPIMIEGEPMRRGYAIKNE